VELPPESAGTGGRGRLSRHNNLELRSLTPLPLESCRARRTARRPCLGLREVPQDSVHDIVVNDERDDPHLAAATGADQGLTSHTRLVISAQRLVPLLKVEPKWTRNPLNRHEGSGGAARERQNMCIAATGTHDA